MLNDWMYYVGIGNSELTILTDFDAPIEVQKYFFGELNERGILYSTHSIETLRSVKNHVHISCTCLLFYSSTENLMIKISI